MPISRTGFALEEYINIKTYKTMKPYCKRHDEVCNECEQEFIDEMNRLVGAVEGYSARDHRHKREEVNAAYPPKSNAATGNKHGKR